MNLAHKYLKISVEELENRLNIHLDLYDNFICRLKQSSNSQLQCCPRSFGIRDESHQYKTKNGMGWQIAMKAKIGIQLQAPAILEFLSLLVWCYLVLQQFRTVALGPGASRHHTTAKVPVMDVNTPEA